MMLKHNTIISLLVALLINLFAPVAHAFVSPLSASILPPVQFPPEDFSVTGLRASVFWGKHHGVYGLDLGLIGNITTQNFVGSAVSGIFNATTGETDIIGVQLAGITNVNTNKTRVYGAQLALGMNYNSAESRVVGVQASLLGNLSDHTNVYGAQIGLYNTAMAVYGFQLGLVNVCQSLHGIQIGLVNFNHSGIFAVSPFLNIGF